MQQFSVALQLLMKATPGRRLSGLKHNNEAGSDPSLLHTPVKVICFTLILQKSGVQNKKTFCLLMAE